MRTPLLLSVSAVVAGLPGCVASPVRSDSGRPCSASEDADGDGLHDCLELDLGTRPDAADTDGDGFDDAEEVACVSDPLDASEICYACGWPHNDPGTLSGIGASVGNTIENLEFIDQCGERVALWDLSGSWHVLFMTASWCGSCVEEARRFEEQQAVFEAMTGRSFSFVTTLFQDSAGSLPGPDEAARYAEAAQIADQPVFADPVAGVLTATPYSGAALPGVCALDPNMVLLDCTEGNFAVEAMLAVVEAAAP